MSKTIEIPDPVYRELLVHVRGVTPLLCDRFGESVREEFEMREANPQLKKEREARDADREFRESLYLVAEANGKPAVYGFPGAGIKKSLVMAGYRYAGLDTTVTGGVISIPLVLVPLINASAPTHRVDPRGIKGQRSSLIHRAEFETWEMEVPVVFDAEILETDQVVRLFAHAGRKVGIGNWRPEKKGDFGQFEIVGVSIKE